MNKKFITLCLLLLFNLIKSSAQIVTATGKRISAADMDIFIDKQVELLAIPGISIAFVHNGKIVYHKESGFADMKDSVKVTRNTLFEAASMSKSVFTYYTLKLVDKGLIHLDTPLYRYLPYPDIAYDERYKLITARMVLNHTSGFPNWREMPSNSSIKLPKKGALYLNFTPGTQVSYSGEGFQYLAKVVAHQCGTDLEGLSNIINRDFLCAIGMKYSSFGWNEYVKEHKAKGYLNNGAGLNEPGEPQIFKGVNAAAGLYSNAEEFTNFLIVLSNGKGLKTSTHSEMLKEQSHPLQPSSERDAWGLGVSIKHTAQGLRYSHSGSNSSFTSFYSLYKDKKVGYVFFLNNNMAPLLISRLETLMSTGNFPAEKEVISLSTDILDKYVGKYEVKPGVQIIISRLDNKLFFQQSNQNYKFEIFPQSEDSFFFRLDPAEIHFASKGSKVVEMQLKNGNGISNFQRAE